MRPQWWLVIGAGMILINGYDILTSLINDQRSSYLDLLFCLAGVLLVVTSYYEMKKKPK